MKKLLLSVLLCAFAFTCTPVSAATLETVSETELLPVFKKKKGSKARYVQIKRQNGSYVKHRPTHKKKSIF